MHALVLHCEPCACQTSNPPHLTPPSTLLVPCGQVEFYFSDANLHTDKHLLQQINKDPDGYGKQRVRLLWHIMSCLGQCWWYVHRPQPCKNSSMYQQAGVWLPAGLGRPLGV